MFKTLALAAFAAAIIAVAAPPTHATGFGAALTHNALTRKRQSRGHAASGVSWTT